MYTNHLIDILILYKLTVQSPFTSYEILCPDQNIH